MSVTATVCNVGEARCPACMIGDDRKFPQGLHHLSRVHFMDIGFTLPAGDPSLRGGNGIPPRCVYLEEMAADLDGQDWLDMDNIEQVRPRQRLLKKLAFTPCLPLAPSVLLSSRNTFYIFIKTKAL